MNSKSKDKNTESDESNDYTNAEETSSNKTPYGDELRLSTNADKNDVPNEKIVVHETIGNTHIACTGNDIIGYFATLGVYRLCEPKNTREEVIEKVLNKDWDIIIGVINATCDLNNVELLKQLNLNK